MHEAWADQLASGERVLWRGAPRPGIHVRLSDLVLGAVGLLFMIVSFGVVRLTFPYGLLLPHLWIGLYLVCGRFFFENASRKRTSYLVTESRAIIVRSWPRKKVTTINLQTVQDLHFVEHRDGTGTVTFNTTRLLGLAGKYHLTAPGFEFIDGAAEVHSFLQSLLRRW